MHLLISLTPIIYGMLKFVGIIFLSKSLSIIYGQCVECANFDFDLSDEEQSLA
jgi:hypothetical protein